MEQQEAQPTAWQRVWRFPLTRIFTYFGVMLIFVLALYFPILGLLKLFHLHTRHHAEVGDLVNEIYFALCAVGAYALMVRVVEKRTMASAGLPSGASVGKPASEC